MWYPVVMEAKVRNFFGARVAVASVIACLMLLVCVSVPASIGKSTDETQKTFDFFGLSTDPGNGNILVTNHLTSSLLNYTKDGTLLWEDRFTFKPSLAVGECEPIEIKGLVGVVKKTKYSNFVYVTDAATRNVYNITNNRLANPAEAKLSEPVQTAVYENPEDWREYVVDRKGNKLLCFLPPKDGNTCNFYSKLLWSVPQNSQMDDAKPGNGNFSFDSPSGVCVGLSGIVYVSDTGNDRIVSFGHKGGYLSSITGFSRPTGIDFAGFFLYVCDTFNRKVLVINTITNETVLSLTNPEMIQPTSVTADLDGNIWVGDCSSDKLFKFSGVHNTEPGSLLLEIKDVLKSKKYLKTSLEVDLKKYTCKKNGKTIKINPYARTLDGVDMIPIQCVFENLFVDPQNPEKTLAQRSYDIDSMVLTTTIPEFASGEDKKYEARTVKISLKSEYATVNGKQVEMPAKPGFVDGRTMIPIFSLQDLFGADVCFKTPGMLPVTVTDRYTIIFPGK